MARRVAPFRRRTAVGHFTQFDGLAEVQPGVTGSFSQKDPVRGRNEPPVYHDERALNATPGVVLALVVVVHADRPNLTWMVTQYDGKGVLSALDLVPRCEPHVRRICRNHIGVHQFVHCAWVVAATTEHVDIGWIR
eukprot:scaffold118277_cov29-Tisochrysis_lutea.AAC.4